MFITVALNITLLSIVAHTIVTLLCPLSGTCKSAFQEATKVSATTPMWECGKIFRVHFLSDIKCRTFNKEEV